MSTSGIEMAAGTAEAHLPLIEFEWSSQRLDMHDRTEDWTGVTSSIERRKLQNRLNQRARRLRSKNRLPTPSIATSSKRPANDGVGEKTGSKMTTVSVRSAKNRVPVARSGCLQSSPRVKELMARFAEHAKASYMQGTPSLTHLQLLVKYNLSHALARNAELLGVTAEYVDWNGISPLNKHGPLLESAIHDRFVQWPVNLHPTTLQFSVEHHPWIDVFPWPRLRDNMLQALKHPEICDEDELCNDICDLSETERHPALIIWGSPWDPRSWEVTTAFLRKWGWLLHGCTEALESTNYWRTKRGERCVSAKQLEVAVMSSMPRLLRSSDL